MTDFIAPDPFGAYIVWSPSGTTPPRLRYSTRKIAAQVAIKMAEKHIGQTFRVAELHEAYLAEPEKIEKSDNEFIAFRQRWHLTQTELAGELGFSVRAIQEIEHNKTEIRTIHRLALEAIEARLGGIPQE